MLQIYENTKNSLSVWNSRKWDEWHCAPTRTSTWSTVSTWPRSLAIWHYVHYTIVLLCRVQHEKCCAHGQVMLGEAKPSPTYLVHEHNISHVGRRRVRQLFCCPLKISQQSPKNKPQSHKKTKIGPCLLYSRRQIVLFFLQCHYMTSNNYEGWQCNMSFNDLIECFDLGYSIWRQCPTIKQTMQWTNSIDVNNQ